MKDNTRYTKLKELCPELSPTQLADFFVTHSWPCFIDAARGHLTNMLTMPNIDETRKDAIAQALIDDNMLGRGKIKTTLPPELLN